MPPPLPGQGWRGRANAAWSSALVDAGHAVLAASIAREALALIREGAIDVIVIDTYDPRAGVGGGHG